MTGRSPHFAGVARIRALAAFVLVAANFAAPETFAREPASGPATHAAALDADSVHLQGVESLIGGGRLDEAAAALRARPNATDYGKLHGRFLAAMIAKGRGDFAGARSAFRDILADQPQLARVRLELADTLQRMGEADAARFHYERLLSEPISPDIKDRIRAAMVDLDKRRRWTAHAYLAFAPSTNVNQGPSNANVSIGGLPFVVDPNTVSQTGWGLAYGVHAAWIQPVTPTFAVVATVATAHLDYDGDRFDDRSVTATVGPQFRAGPLGYFGVEAVASRRWYGGDAFSWSVGGRAYTRMIFEDRHRVSTSVSVLAQTYDQVPVANGWHAAGTITYDHLFDSLNFLRLTVGVDRDQTGLAHLDFTQGMISLGYWRELGWGVTLFPEIGIVPRAYDGPFPLLGVARNDLRLFAGLTVTKRDWTLFGFAPRLSYTYSHNDSNVALYRFDKHDVFATLVREF